MGGAIQLDNNVGEVIDTDSGLGPGAAGNVGAAFNDLSTLEEPVMETIKRDLRNIWGKLKIVVNPMQMGVRGTPNNIEEKRQEVRNWDLWGPFLFTLLLSVLLSGETEADDSNLIFEIVFIIVWFGGAVIAMNGQLLGGTISFFQSICLLGYCLFPILLAASVNLIIGKVVPFLLKLIYVGAAFVWATYSSNHFISEMVPADRKELAMYPVILFYLFLSWCVML